MLRDRHIYIPGWAPFVGTDHFIFIYLFHFSDFQTLPKFNHYKFFNSLTLSQSIHFKANAGLHMTYYYILETHHKELVRVFCLFVFSLLLYLFCTKCKKSNRQNIKHVCLILIYIIYTLILFYMFYVWFNPNID